MTVLQGNMKITWLQFHKDEKEAVKKEAPLSVNMRILKIENYFYYLLIKCLFGKEK